MKRRLSPILIAAIIAILVLIVSQAIWIRYAARQESLRQENNFQTNFREAISTLINITFDQDPSLKAYQIDFITDEEIETDKKSGKKIRETNAGNTKDGVSVADALENALITLSIADKKFRTQQLDSILTSLINKESKVVSSHIILMDTKMNVKLDKTSRNYRSTSPNFFVKTYHAERKVEIPEHSYVIKADYEINPPVYLQRMGWMTILSVISSLVILGVMFFFLRNLRKRKQEAANMERSFHGAIHDLKSPLAYVYALLSSLEDSEEDVGKRVSLSVSQDRVSYLSDKINRMLKSGRDIEKLTDTDKQTVYLYDLLEQIDKEVKSLFREKQLEISYNLPDDYAVRVMPDLFEASLRVLIENGVRYNSQNPHILISAVKEQGAAKIMVSDDGEGMDKRQLKNIFKPYYTSDKKNGSGIGLYYAQRIVRAHKGMLTVKSEPNKGSVFTITLPENN